MLLRAVFITTAIIPAWSTCCIPIPLRLSKSIVVAFALVKLITGITASPIPPLPPSPLLLSVLLLHLKRRPVDCPRKLVHDIDPDAANAHNARVLVNGQVRPRVPRRSVRHRRRA